MEKLTMEARNQVQSSTFAASSKNTSLRAAMISRQVTLVFSAYRKTDFADPAGFVMQLGTVLERYPDPVIEYATDPRTGIQRKCVFPPSIAEVVNFCDTEMARLARIEHYQKMGSVKPRIPSRPKGYRWNVFVPADNAKYPGMVERAKKSDGRDFHVDASRPGIWVPLGWLEDGTGSLPPRAFRSYAEDELRRLYGVANATAAQENKAKLDEIAAKADKDPL